MWKKLLKPFMGFWEEDRGLSALLLALLGGMFVVPPFVTLGWVSPILLQIVFSLIILTGSLTVTRSRHQRIAVVCIVVLAVIVQWGNVVFPSRLGSVLDGSLSILITLILATFVLLQVFRQGPITVHRVAGAVVVYLLLGLAWGEAYRLTDLVSPGAFSFSSTFVGRRPDRLAFDLIYFSFVTLTTVGYGDVTALHPAARSLAVLEALTGQLFPAILIARLVSMQTSARKS